MSEIENAHTIEGRLKELSETENRALLIGVYEGASERESINEHIDELANLCDTYGLNAFSSHACPLRKVDASTFIGKGKVEEIRKMCVDEKINVVIFDNEISPQQQRNLEKAFSCMVVDRTELILGVFEKHAKTKESKIQIDLAKMRYQLPRLKRLWTHLSRQRTGGSAGGGSGGFLKGEGERQIEIDRRLVRKKIDKLRNELEQVKKNRETQRKARIRQNIPTVAIVGYTNAGKSTLLNSLTGASVLVEDKLFATLDTTTRKFSLPNKQKILLIDTVGFIRKIPHTLVAAFKSTLEEAVNTDILIHLVDVSNSSAYDQATETMKVLAELGAKNKPIITVLNKIDVALENPIRHKIRIHFSRSLEVSAKDQTGFEDLSERIIQEIALLRKTYTLKIPQSNYALVSRLMEVGKVFSCEYEENDILVSVEIPQGMEREILEFVQE